jgi:M6 family metalloprotease-like protein
MQLFLARRASGVSGALLFAVITVLLAGSVGMAAPEPGSAASRQSTSGNVLEGILSIETTPLQPDGSHWAATLDVDGRVVRVRISHDDSHRPELQGAVVRVTGSWAADGIFVAAALVPVGAPDGDDDTLLAAATAAGKVLDSSKRGRDSVEGTLSFAHGDDFAHGRKTSTNYFVTDRKGKSTEVIFAKAPATRLMGKQVRLTGTLKAGRLLADGGTIANTTSATTTTSSTGAHKVAVILFNFLDATSQPYTPAFAAGIAFNNSDSVAAYYNEVSWGQLTLSGDVYGWYTLPLNRGTTCSYSTWANAANTAAAAGGFVYANYDNIVYAFAGTGACGWSGLAYMPGKESWLNGVNGMGLRTMAHELGHNFGTPHSSTVSCSQNGARVALVNDVSTCTLGEYGDPFSVMGGASRLHHTNWTRDSGYHWVAGTSIQTITSGGDFAIAPAEVQNASTPSVLRVTRTTGQTFTLEFRQPYGSLFETLSSTSPAANGVTVRLTGSSSTNSRLIDCTPSTISFSDAPCPVGTTLTDPLSGVSFTVVSVSSGGAVVHISFGGAPTPTPIPTPTPTPTPTPSPTPTPIPTPTPSPTPTPTPTPSPTPTPTPTPVDTVPPSAPAQLTATVAKANRVSLSWSRSVDNVKVAGYQVYRDGTLVATTSTNRWNDAVRLAVGAGRSYYVLAFDAAGNVSAASNVVTLP